MVWLLRLKKGSASEVGRNTVEDLSGTKPLNRIKVDGAVWLYKYSVRFWIRGVCCHGDSSCENGIVRVKVVRKWNRVSLWANVCTRRRPAKIQNCD